jgi:4a-hydroxytetrahydrobiopterin dehydratase
MEWITKEGKLVNTFDFKSQTELAEFVLKIAKQADKVHHHPDFKIFKAFTIEITLFTYDKNAITELDYKLSEFISSQFSLEV